MSKIEYLELLGSPEVTSLNKILESAYQPAYNKYIADKPSLVPQVKATFLIKCIQYGVSIATEDWEWILDSNASRFSNGFKENSSPIIDELIDIVKDPDFNPNVTKNLSLARMNINHNVLPHAIKLMDTLYKHHPTFTPTYLFGRNLVELILKNDRNLDELKQNILNLRSFVDNPKGRQVLDGRELVHTSIQVVSTLERYKNTPAYKHVLDYAVSEHPLKPARLILDSAHILNSFSSHVLDYSFFDSEASTSKLVNQLKSTNIEICLSRTEWQDIQARLLNEHPDDAIFYVTNAFGQISAKLPNYIELLTDTVQFIAQHTSPKQLSIVDVASILGRAIENVYIYYLIDKLNNNLDNNLHNWSEKLHELLTTFHPIYKHPSALAIILIPASTQGEIMDNSITYANILDDILNAYVHNKPDLKPLLTTLVGLSLDNYGKISTLINEYANKNITVDAAPLPALN